MNGDDGDAEMDEREDGDGWIGFASGLATSPSGEGSRFTLGGHSGPRTQMGETEQIARDFM